DGDTLRDFLAERGARFFRVDALEPDAVNADRLERMIAALPAEVGARIHPWRVAVGAREGVLEFAATGTVSSSTTDRVAAATPPTIAGRARPRACAARAWTACWRPPRRR